MSDRKQKTFEGAPDRGCASVGASALDWRGAVQCANGGRVARVRAGAGAAGARGGRVLAGLGDVFCVFVIAGGPALTVAAGHIKPIEKKEGAGKGNWGKEGEGSGATGGSSGALDKKDPNYVDDDE